MKLRETIDWGIDLGTTNSCIAVLEGKDTKVIKNNDGDEITPSAVYEKKIGDRIVKRVGKVAKQKLIKEHEHVALEFKQMMGTKEWYFEFPSTKRKALAADLSAEVLKDLLTSVKQRTGEEIYAAVITVPAAFLDPMYEDTKKAGEKAGIKYVEVLEEPVAASLAYGLEANQDGTKRWLAYDLGGGTFDAALVKVEEGEISVFDHAGIRNLGGKHLDAAIVERYFLPALPSSIKDKIVPWKSSTWWTLKFLAEEAKCQLSIKNEYIIEDVVDGEDFVYELTREQLDKLEKEMFLPTIEQCKELLTRNRFKSKDIEKIILIGGPTLSPHLRKMIEEELDIPVDFSVDPLTAVARGAAIYACNRKIPHDILENIRGKLGIKKKGSVHLELNFPPTTQEDEIMVTGKLEPKSNDIAISSEWSVEIEKIDKAGNRLWSSGETSVSEGGGFAIMSVPIEEGENIFRLIVKDAEGKVVETDREAEFRITKTKIRSDIIKMPWGVGVIDVHGEMIWFFKKDTPLPTDEKTIELKTTKELKKGKVGDILKIPIAQGNEDKGYLNRIISILEISAKEVPTTIPAGSKVEVTIKIDESRKVSVNAYLPDYDVEVDDDNDNVYNDNVYAEVHPSMDISFEEIDKSFKEILDIYKRLEDVENYSSSIKEVIEKVREKKMIDEIKKLVLQGKDNLEFRQQAIDKILELRKLFDSVIEEAEKLLKWKAHKEWCDKNIEIAKNIVSNIEMDERNRDNEKWRKWKSERFEPLLKKYQEAVDNRDFKETEKIAYEDLPNLFISAKDVEVWIKTRDGEDIKVNLSQLVGGKATKSESKSESIIRTKGDVEEYT